MERQDRWSEELINAAAESSLYQQGASDEEVRVSMSNPGFPPGLGMSLGMDKWARMALILARNTTHHPHESETNH